VTKTSDKVRRTRACAKLVSLRGKSETSPRFVPAHVAGEYDAILDSLEALGYNIAKFRILPYEFQRFASYVVVSPGQRNGPPAKGGYYVNRSLLTTRIDSALTHVGVETSTTK
jgi:hypothetical protein